MQGQRVNLTLADREVETLRGLYYEYTNNPRTRWNPSFTGFCAMVLVETAFMLENGELEFGEFGSIRRTPGRPREVKG